MSDGVNEVEYVAPPVTQDNPAMPKPGDKPEVQRVNEQLVDTPTGYVSHDPCFDLDKAQLDSIQNKDSDDPDVQQAVGEDENRVADEENQPEHQD